MVNLTETELAGMRRDAAVALLDTATIRRKTAGVWASVATVPARLRLTTSRANQRLAEAAEETDADGTVYLPHDTDVRRLDNVVVAGRRCEVRFVVPVVRVHLQVLVKVDR